MRGKLGGDVQRRAIGVVDNQAARVQVHLAADAAGQKRRRPPIFAIANNRMANRRHMDAQLMGSPGQRLQFNPCRRIARALQHPIAGARGGAMFGMIDKHLLAAGAGLLGKGQVDLTGIKIGNPRHQRPIYLARRTSSETDGEIGRRAGGGRNQ